MVGPKKEKRIVDTPQKSKEIKYINNVLLKKLKIALSMTTDDILEVFAEAEIYPSKGEIGAPQGLKFRWPSFLKNAPISPFDG